VWSSPPLAGARRLGGNACGLAPWATTRLEAPNKPPIQVTATPCRHGPPLSRPIAGEVTGFALAWPGQEHGALWITGDSVLYDGVRRVAGRLQVGTAILHLGCVRFPVTGPVRYSMIAQEAVELCRLVRPRTAIPHFHQGRDAIERVFAQAATDIGRRLQWLPIGRWHQHRRLTLNRLKAFTDGVHRPTGSPLREPAAPTLRQCLAWLESPAPETMITADQRRTACDSAGVKPSGRCCRAGRRRFRAR
jgi:hypothetical protein